MKKLFALFFAALAVFANAQTFPVQNLQVNGTSSFAGTMSGAGLVSHDAGVNHIQTVLNVAALRTTNCVPGLLYATQGYTTIADWGQGTYVCNGSDTTSIDNGGTIIAAANTYRFYLQIAGGVTVKQFGSICNGSATNTAADTVGFNNAIAASLSIFIPPGNCIIGPTGPYTGTLLYLGTNSGNPNRSGMHIWGAGEGASKITLANSAGTNVLLFGLGTTDTISDITFDHFTMDLNGANNNINTIYNNAFYMFGVVTNATWEHMTFKNMAGQQTIRVGKDTAAGFGNNIKVSYCTFDTFGIGGGWSTSDISVLFIEANNINISNNVFTNPSFTLNASLGHTAIEVNGDKSTLIFGNSFNYVQLPILVDSIFKDNFNTRIVSNNFTQTNEMIAFDSGSTFAQSAVTVAANQFMSTFANTSAIIQIGTAGEASKTRENYVIASNKITTWGNANSGINLIYNNGTYMRSMLIENNDIGGLSGSLLAVIGAIQNTGLMDVTIAGNRLDSLGSCFVDMEATSGILNAFNVTGNTFFNTSATNYSVKGAIKLSGSINVVNITGNVDGIGGIGTSYPFVQDSMTLGNWVTKIIQSSSVSALSELPVNYRPNVVTIGATSSVNIFDFSGFTLNNFAVLDIDVWVNIGGSANGDLTSYKVLVGSSGKIVGLIAHGSGFGTTTTLNFSGNILRVTSSSGSVVSALFFIRGWTSIPITWLI